MVQYCFTSTESIRLIMMESPGWPPRLSHSPWTLAESWVRRFSLCLACKPYAGLRVCPHTGRWCTSGVATRSLSLFTKQADSYSQISCLDSWCATRISKTLDVVHRYAALLVSNCYFIVYCYILGFHQWLSLVYLLWHCEPSPFNWYCCVFDTHHDTVRYWFYVQVMHTIYVLDY